MVYPTGVAGTATQATVLAYNNLYEGTCTGQVPSIAWAYNTAGTATLSPTISEDATGSQIAYVQSSGSGAQLVLLTWANSGGTQGAPAAITSEASSAYRGCTAPCYTTVTFNGGTADSNSAPYYVYGGAYDTIYVGDNSGVLHKFTGVFYGTPTEVITGGWPLTVHSGSVLTSPVFDFNTLNIFVGDASGRLSYVREVNSTTGACASGLTPCLGLDNATLAGPIADPPLVDSTTAKVFAFSGVTSAVVSYEVLQTDEALTTANNKTQTFAGVTGRTYTSNMRAGTFDNIYFTSGAATGHLYVCAPDNNGTSYYNGAALYQIGFASSAGVMNTTTSGGPLAMVSASPASGATVDDCAPLSEFYDGTTDYLFASVTQYANLTGCTGSATAACLYNFNITSGMPTVSVAGINATGGTSGIIIDNALGGAGESQIYYTPLSSMACGGNGTTGNSTAACAVQTSQSTP